MTGVIEIRMGGYGPPTTAFSRALKFAGDRVEAEFGGRVIVRYVWNIMDFGYRGEDILWLVESGVLHIGYQSSSYLTGRAPKLGFVDLPFLFQNNDQARSAIDGELGRRLTEIIEKQFEYRILGYFENGFRQISNRHRPVHRPDDLAGMKIRVLPSDIQARTFELLGAEPVKMDLSEAIESITTGELDAQENPFANTVTYGVHNFHRFHTLSNHFYISRPIFAHRKTVDGWPEDVRIAVYAAIKEAIGVQRGLSEAETIAARTEIEGQGGEIVELTRSEHDAFVHAVEPLYADAREMFTSEMFGLADR